MIKSHDNLRHGAMKDSWSHGDDRRDRGRIDRGVGSHRRSRSPEPRRRPDSRRDDRSHDRAAAHDSRPSVRSDERRREHSPERRRPASRSPKRDAADHVRERNRGRELLIKGAATKPTHIESERSPVHKRHKSPSPSRDLSSRKKSRRSRSRSPAYISSRSARSEHPRRPQSPERRRSRESISRLDTSTHRSAFDKRSSEHFRRDHSRDRREPLSSRARRDSPRRGEEHRARPRSRSRSAGVSRGASARLRSPVPRSTVRPRVSYQDEPRSTRRRSPGSAHRDRDPRPGQSSRSRPASSDRHRDPRPTSPRPSHSRKEPRPSSSHIRQGDALEAAGVTSKSPSERLQDTGSAEVDPNTVEVSNKRGRAASPAPANKEDRRRREKEYDSRPGDREDRDDGMAGRGYSPYGYQQHPNQMQAAFPQRPQYGTGPPQHYMDPRFSHSPQHIPQSYHNSPQAHSPYSDGRGGFHHQQFSPPQQHFTGNFAPTNNYVAPQPQVFYPQQSPPYQNQVAQQAIRGSRGGSFRGGFQSRGNINIRGRGGFAVGRGQSTHVSGNTTPLHVSPPSYHNASSHGSPANGQQSRQQVSHPDALTSTSAEDDDDDLFRPSKELQVEDMKKPDIEKMPPPDRPPANAPTGPQSNKFSFAFKASAKPPAAAPKPEISQKLTAVPKTSATTPRDVRSPPKGPQGSRSAIPTGPSSRSDIRKEAPPPRKIKKIVLQPKARPLLPEEFKSSDSVYYRKPGNESVVGSGTYGKVFKAIHVYTKKLVALKKIRMEGERDGFPVTAVREIKLLQSLKHANVVHMQEVMVEKNDCFMVFEYLSHDLTGLLNHPTFTLSPAHKKHLAKQMFEGLDYLHRRGVLHRDIKAANILVSNEGQLKLADFGLARFYAKRKALDYTNRVITIWYRSPELLFGETQYGCGVDIWSAACVLVEIFTRHAIFPGDGGEISQLDKIYNILGTPTTKVWAGLTDAPWFELLRPTRKQPNVFADKYQSRVPPAAFELLVDMFQYDPAKRPSAADVLEHPYFTIEEPAAQQAFELQKLEGDWHEFESKALRKENEKKEKEARRALVKEGERVKEVEKTKEGERENDKGKEGKEPARREKKRDAGEDGAALTQSDREAKRVQIIRSQDVEGDVDVDAAMSSVVVSEDLAMMV